MTVLVEGEDLLALVAEGGFGGVQLGCRVVGRIGHVHAQSLFQALARLFVRAFRAAPHLLFAAL